MTEPPPLTHSIHPIKDQPEGMSTRHWITYQRKWQGFTAAEIGVELGRDRTTIQTYVREIRKQYGPDWVPDVKTIVAITGQTPQFWGTQKAKKAGGLKGAGVRLHTIARRREAAATEVKKLADAIIDIAGMRLEPYLSNPELVQELSLADVKDLMAIAVKLYPLADLIELTPNLANHQGSPAGIGQAPLGALVGGSDNEVLFQQLTLIRSQKRAEDEGAADAVEVQAIEAARTDE